MIEKPTPTPYAPSLKPLPSDLRPHVLARDRLRLWRPLSARNTLDQHGIPTNLTTADLERVKDVLEGAWADSTKEAYGAGLLIFHVFCDRKSIPDEQRAPASPVLISAFISTITGACSGKSINNYVHGIRAWHVLHSVEWRMDTAELSTLLKAADKATPPSSRRSKRTPFTIDFILTIRNNLDLSTPLHAAVFACLTTIFYTASRVGEFTVPNLKAFSSQVHVKPTDVRTECDRQGLESTIFSLPVTKASPMLGEEVSWCAQTGLSDPKSTFNHHMQTNKPPDDGPLFAYAHQNSHRPLTKPKLIEVLARAAKAAGLDPRQGHGIRIGATLELLLRGVPFDVVKVKGRWASNAFETYLTKHAQILAPYMQDKPELYTSFVRLTMPPPR